MSCEWHLHSLCLPFRLVVFCDTITQEQIHTLTSPTFCTAANVATRATSVQVHFSSVSFFFSPLQIATFQLPDQASTSGVRAISKQCLRAHSFRPTPTRLQTHSQAQQHTCWFLRVRAHHECALCEATLANCNHSLRR